jgi:hypothetical protein
MEIKDEEPFWNDKYHKIAFQLLRDRHQIYDHAREVIIHYLRDLDVDLPTPSSLDSKFWRFHLFQWWIENAKNCLLYFLISPTHQ